MSIINVCFSFYRAQFHTCAVDAEKLSFFKVDLDEACESKLKFILLQFNYYLYHDVSLSFQTLATCECH